MAQKSSRISKKVKRFIAGSLIFFFGSTILTTVIYGFLPVPLTPYMVIQCFENKDFRIKKDWVPLSKISEELSLAVIASEDQRFLDHFGFDIQAIEKAIEREREGRGEHTPEADVKRKREHLQLTEDGELLAVVAEDEEDSKRKSRLE